MTLHLTRAVLDRDATAAALAPLLDPPEPSRALDAHHRLIWTLFPGKDAVRDFLWRADGRGRFFIFFPSCACAIRLVPPTGHDRFRSYSGAG